MIQCTDGHACEPGELLRSITVGGAFITEPLCPGEMIELHATLGSSPDRNLAVRGVRYGRLPDGQA